MNYTAAFRLFAAGLLSASVLRIIMKLFYIDLETGFLIQNHWTLTLLYLILAAVALAAMAASYRSKEQEPVPEGYHPAASLLLALTAVFIGVHAALRYLYPDTSPKLINIPRWLASGELILAGAASIALLYAAFLLYRAKGHCLPAAFATLVVVLWQSAWAIVRFSAFWQVSTLSDHLLESFYLALAPLFWMAQAYFLSGIPKKRIGGRVITLGLTLAVVAIPLTLGQAATLIAYQGLSKGPSPINCLMLLSMGLYTAVFSINVDKLYRR